MDESPKQPVKKEPELITEEKQILTPPLQTPKVEEAPPSATATNCTEQETPAKPSPVTPPKSAERQTPSPWNQVVRRLPDLPDIVQ